VNIHKNAPLTFRSRAELVRRVLDDGQTPKAVATAFGVCPKTVKKWLERYRQEGPEGLHDRSSRPHRLRKPTPEAVCQRVVERRYQRCTGAQIAAETGISPATVSRILKRHGLNRLKSLEPAEPVRRYERQRPGELLHIDIKKLGRFNRPGHRVTGDRTGQSNARGIGWEYVHVCIDDHSRLAFSQILPDEKKESAVAFLKAAVAYYASLGITVERVMTDNGACYKSKAFAKACGNLKLTHKRTRPYTPKTNGKAERFIQTSLREWAYARAYHHSNARTAGLSIGRNNLLRLHT
jgi:transposase